MSDVYNFITSDDPRTGALSASQLDARRKIAIALATRNRPYPKTIGEGLTALGEGLGEGMYNNSLARAEAAQSKYNAGVSKDITSGGLTSPQPIPGGASLEGGDQATQAYAMVPPDAAADTGPVFDPAKLSPEDRQKLEQARAYSGPKMSIDEWKARTARNETGGEKDPYSAIGAEANRRGDRAYGKYQVMGENIPIWTKQYLGKAMMPQDFLADPKAQEDLASARGGEYLAKYGPRGAAAAWFAGEKGMRDQSRPNLQSHIAEYQRRFDIPLVSRDQVVASAARAPSDPENAAPFQVAALGGGVPTPDTAPDPREAVAQTLAGPPPQQVAQAAGLPPPQAQPTVLPQAIPPVPAQEARPRDPGPEPRLRSYIEGNPELVQRLRRMEEIANDPRTEHGHVLQAREKYNELLKGANDAFNKQWTVWHEDFKEAEKFRLTEEERKIKRVKERGEAEDAAAQRDLRYRFGMDPAEGFKKLDKDQTVADMAQTVRDDNRTILQAVRDGVIMGSGAGWRVNASKLAAFALQNGYASEQAANTEILRAMGGSRIRERLAQVNPVGVASNTDLLLARQLSGAEATMEPKSFMALLHKSSMHNARLINDYEDKIDSTLGGHRAHRQYQLAASPTAPQGDTDKMLANRDDKSLRAQYDDRYGEGSSALEIERFNRRQKRGQ